MKNGTGEGMLVVMLPGLLVSALNVCILASDWFVWLADVLIQFADGRRRRSKRVRLPLP